MSSHSPPGLERRLSFEGSRGFTLVELVVTLALIGILAAIAVPAFRDIGGQARQASMIKMRGDAMSTIQTTWITALAQGQTGATGTLLVGGQTVNLKYGYPTKGSLNKVFTLPTPGQGDFEWWTAYPGWDLSGNDAVMHMLFQNKPISFCWFGYREATASSPAVVSAISSADNCASQSSGLAPYSGTYVAD